MMADRRCKHLEDVTILEGMGGVSLFRFRGRKLVDDSSHTDGPTGVYVAQCNVCGRSVRIKGAGKLPPWAKGLWQRYLDGEATS